MIVRSTADRTSGLTTRRCFLDVRGARGASVVELAILTPLLIFVTMLAVQFAMWFHAKHVALAAAREGARVARAASAGPWEDKARERAEDVLERIGGARLFAGRPTFIPEVGPNDSRGIRVTGKVVQVWPVGPRLDVSEVSLGPVECFRPDDGSTDCG